MLEENVCLNYNDKEQRLYALGQPYIFKLNNIHYIHLIIFTSNAYKILIMEGRNINEDTCNYINVLSIF